MIVFCFLWDSKFIYSVKKKLFHQLFIFPIWSVTIIQCLFDYSIIKNKKPSQPTHRRNREGRHSSKQWTAILGFFCTDIWDACRHSSLVRFFQFYRIFTPFWYLIFLISFWYSWNLGRRFSCAWKTLSSQVFVRLNRFPFPFPPWCSCMFYF